MSDNFSNEKVERSGTSLFYPGFSWDKKLPCSSVTAQQNWEPCGALGHNILVVLSSE